MEILSYIVDNALILIPALMIVGAILKDFILFPDKWIPLCLLPLGVLGSIGLMGLSADSIIQGVLVVGVAVYGNQIFKQIGKKY